MQGIRLYPDAEGNYPWSSIQPGSYFHKDGDGWYGMTPNGHMAALRKHACTEHEDGTLTVSPSILVSGNEHVQLWHGFLEKGIWREC